MKLKDRYPKDISKAISNNAYMIIDRYPQLPYWIKSLQIPAFNNGSTRIPTPQFHGSWNIPSVQGELDDITIMWYCDENLVTYFSILEWIRYSQSVVDVTDAMSDIVITITNNAKQPIIHITLVDAFPTSVGTLDFDTYNVEPVLPFVTFKVNNIKWNYLDESMVDNPTGKV